LAQRAKALRASSRKTQIALSDRVRAAMLTSSGESPFKLSQDALAPKQEHGPLFQVKRR